MNRLTGKTAILLVGAGLFLVSFAFYLLNLLHLSPYFFSGGGPFFGADTFDISKAMRVPTFHYDMQRHLLFSVLTESLVDVAGLIFRLTEDMAIMVSLALMSAANVTFAWWTLRRFVTSMALATALAVTYGLYFSNIIFFSIPETYTLSNLFIIAYFALLLLIRNERSLASAAILGAAAGVAGLFNPTLMSLSLVGFLYQWRWSEKKQGIAYGFVTLLVALVVCGVPYLYVHGMGYVEFVSDYTNQWASLGNLLEVDKYAMVGVGFFLYSVVTPLTSLTKVVTLNDLAGYLSDPLTLVTLIAYIAFVILASGRAIRDSDRLVIPVIAWTGVMLLFFVYFNPPEALLYSSQILFPLALLAARGLAVMSLADKFKTGLVACFAILLALNNIPVLYNPFH